VATIFVLQGKFRGCIFLNYKGGELGEGAKEVIDLVICYLSSGDKYTPKCNSTQYQQPTTNN
jgi:hypothetical protein